METKKQEKIVKIKSVEELEALNREEFCYAAANILRAWDEDFTNEDNGEVVTIERTSILYSKGERLDPDSFSAILFHFQSGDLKEVALSNQQRRGFVIEDRSWGVWEVKASAYKTKLNILLYANNAVTAYEIVKDYIELNYNGDFTVNSIKTADQSTIINKDYSYNHLGSERERDWFSISMIIEVRDDERISRTGPYDYVVSADTADEGRSVVESYIAEKRSERGETAPFSTIMQEAKVINCNAIIPDEFCLAYKKDDEI
jgi:peptidoglycan hydrolase-like protein with peptidoglycan-binding domain